jgi:BlaI family penicillinase repressor
MAAPPEEIRLGRLELRIMNIVWDKGTATVHDVKTAISRGRKPAYSTILTMMRKLEAKGFLEHDVRDRTYVYRPSVSRRTVRQSILRDLLDRLFEGSPSLLVTSLVEGHIADEELGEIRKLLEKERAKK